MKFGNVAARIVGFTLALVIITPMTIAFASQAARIVV